MEREDDGLNKSQRVIVAELAQNIMGPVRKGAMSVEKAIVEVRSRLQNNRLSRDLDRALRALLGNLTDLKRDMDFVRRCWDGGRAALEEWRFPYFPKVFNPMRHHFRIR